MFCNNPRMPIDVQIQYTQDLKKIKHEEIIKQYTWHAQWQAEEKKKTSTPENSNSTILWAIQLSMKHTPHYSQDCKK
jgi:hypothetical protein